jgi:F5/8 type C domain
LDDQLRSAIDRLVKDGGRLIVHAASGGSSVILEQPGSRFGILEVGGRVLLPSTAERAAADLLARGWTDPSVTLRLGREIRLPRADPGAEAPTTLARTWRVPPALAAEIADSVRAALGEIGQVDFVPLATREPSAVDSFRAPRPPIEEDDIDQPEAERAAGRMVPAPLKGLLAIVLVCAVAVVWAGMIRGAPRVPGPSSDPSPTSVAGVSSVAPSPTPAQATPTSPPSAPAEIRPGAAKASTEDESGPASAAIDGEPATAWHAAFGLPQWIEITLDTPSTVREVVLLIAQGEKGASRHMIQVAVTGQALEVVRIVDRQTTDGDAIVFRPESPIENVERIRIETMASPSNVGWYEVIVR